MCGIVGIVNLDGGPVERGELLAMRDVLVHRGPDDAGLHVSDSVGLGARRLSIIDLAGGRQPISNEDGSVWAVFNGEIYNHATLRAELVRKGHVFATRCDTEVVVHGYEEWGDAFLEKCRGVFGLAIWDRKRRRLLLARDRFGIKPLYYHLSRERLIFASEIRALLRVGAPRRLDLGALWDYLGYGFIPGPRTGLLDVSRLSPGHLLRLDLPTSAATLRGWWEPGEVPSPGLDAVRPQSDAEWIAELGRRLEESIAEHLSCEVPLGVFLSGGLDSSLIVALARRHLQKPLNTFSIAFPEASDQNESRFARDVARLCETQHHEIPLDADAFDLMPRVAESLEEPLADPAALPLYVLSHRARELATVVLSGEGGDEVFGGYPRYYWHLRASAADQLPRFARTALRHLADALPDGGPVALREIVRRSRKFAHGAVLPEAERYATWFAIFSDDARTALIDEIRLSAIDASDTRRCAIQPFAERCVYRDPLTRAQYFDLRTYLPDNLLFKTDKLTSSASLEARVPFLDHRLVEFGLRMPPHLRVKGHETKVAVRHLAATLLPPSVVQRPKQGFIVPIERWLRGKALERARAVLLDPSTERRGMFRASAVERLLGRAENGAFLDADRIFALLMFEMWARAMVDPRAPVANRAWSPRVTTIEGFA
jgi:asparagine synthase (glutamine-hydrolysing)